MNIKHLEWAIWEDLPLRDEYTDLMAGIEERYINREIPTPVEAICEEIMMALVEVWDDE